MKVAELQVREAEPPSLLRIPIDADEFARERRRDGLVEFGGRLLSKGLVGALVVVLAAEGIENGLLSAQRLDLDERKLLLEREVHPLVPAILLRLAGLDALVPD